MSFWISECSVEELMDIDSRLSFSTILSGVRGNRRVS